MKINILGYNIFSKGGTSRSNINLIKSLLSIGVEVHYFNYLDFNKNDILKLIIHEELNSKLLKIDYYNSNEMLAVGDVLIFTREEFFNYSKFIKKINRKIKIVGEIHGPLEYIDEETNLALDYIDCIRVSTKEIRDKFINKYNYPNVFNQYVNASHINIQNAKYNTKRNFMVKARFEDQIKDISYIIQLFNYIIKNNINNDIKLYIIGYGPSELLYKNLINYYGLQNHVFLNHKEPKSYIYISASPYETLGYSILETLAIGNKALIYPGDDGVLESIYNKFNSIRFLTKNFEEDALILNEILDYRYTNKDREEDILNLENSFKTNNYAETLLENINKYSINTKNKFKYTKFNKISNKKIKKEINYKKIKENKLIKSILKNKVAYNKAKNYYSKLIEKNEIKKLNKINVNSDYIFIESFHGKNFSGDPKYIALAIKKYYNNKKVFVSSSNSLVDMEIKRYGFTPIRFGSDNYIKTFRKSKYVFMNGNSWDKVYKGKEQIFVQTWHGFPLKKMVNDLNDVEERRKQLNAFLPRMKKWDYLISSSEINTMILNSAFKLEKKSDLIVLENGAPRNQYLIKNRESDTERQRVQQKYLYKSDENKRYILFCPTWRNKKRENLTNINLKKLLSYLPNNYEIIVKLHPNESMLRSKYNNLDKRIHCFFNELVDIQELYILSDCMITDYSSTIFDYVHLNKPIFLLQEDYDKYEKEIGFYFDIFELARFPIASREEKNLAQQILKLQIDYSNIVNLLMDKDGKDSVESMLKQVLK
ncbi:CDP-glycerol glycerophosphotransferase family protein [Staphylococcus haemolyticus]|nr:CDP-glycerol glycerophosphotransferase family protein [Staphylococcus haemolyticus]UII02101.1 hypothetical protein DENEGGJD_00071 [Staphylococcus haemolyticus]